MRKLISLLFLGVFVTFVTPRLWGEFQDRRHSSAWPTVEGTLIDAHIREVVRQTTTSQQGYRPVLRHFVLVIEYAYEVDGREYRGHRVRAGGSAFTTERGAKEALDTFESQESLTVYYDPRDPASSLLIPG